MSYVTATTISPYVTGVSLLFILLFEFVRKIENTNSPEMGVREIFPLRKTLTNRFISYLLLLFINSFILFSIAIKAMHYLLFKGYLLI